MRPPELGGRTAPAPGRIGALSVPTISVAAQIV
ncbi:hypothetical protein GA0070612_2200 [Micromonospora chokoriensis]|uniref:Uncharacterized protein n=1 Tax=Micromonospora chokoriensis TaxID=356851 RepID=A0A1C4W7B5_9ACTN|nr:hypothetical protein GA0070612_2200 [Micromonospora chokoriensis]